MPQVGRQFSHGSHPVDVRQIRLRLTQCFFGAFGRGNVHGGTDQLDDVARVVYDRMSCHAQVFEVPVGSDQPDFVIVVRLFANGLLPRLEHPRPIFGVELI